MLETISYMKTGSTVTRKKYFPQLDSGTEVVFVHGEAMVIYTSQKWFWSEEWQNRNNNSIHELESGDYIEFKQGNDFLKSLNDL